ncbi:MAG: amidohydrolase family protein, partial [Proteobacteria bacterium]|nr:amidohydrolase family protein [Pseudomonadota bacterium]
PTNGEELLIGGMVTPPFAEPHVHLDAALLGLSSPNRSGTLWEGITNWSQLRPTLTEDDIRQRARKTIEMYASTGTLSIRTHVDTGSLLAVQTLLDLRDEVRAEGMDLQVVAFPQEGILRRPNRREQWEEAVSMGCDAVGAIPHIERTTEEGWESIRLAFKLADKHGCSLDFHCDETDDPQSRNLEVVCAQTMDFGRANQVVAGHCTAMHSYSNPYAAKVVDLVAEAGVQVVANPLDNVVLQGRFDSYPKRRGITRVDELWAAGAIVGMGHDSVMDPWYRLGTANMLDVAYMLIHLCHLTGEDQMKRAFKTLFTENHLPFGRPPEVVDGAPARFLWWADDDPIEVLRLRRAPRVFSLRPESAS